MSSSIAVGSNKRLVETKNGVKIVDDFSSTDDKVAINLETIFDFPCSTYMLLLGSKIARINEISASAFGFHSCEDAVGLSMLDITDKQDALEVFRHDAKVIQDRKIFVGNESCVRPNGVLIEGVSAKIPWYNEAGNIIGLFGISLMGGDNLNYLAYLAKYMGLPQLSLQIKRQFAVSYNRIIDNIPLSKRQLECMYHLIRGKSLKQIGKV